MTIYVRGSDDEWHDATRSIADYLARKLAAERDLYFYPGDQLTVTVDAPIGLGLTVPPVDDTTEKP